MDKKQENASWELLPIGGASQEGQEAQEAVLHSWNNHGLFRKLEYGCSKAIQGQILVGTMLRAVQAGASEADILETLQKPYFGLTNNSQWCACLDKNLQWKSPEGELIPFRKRFGKGEGKTGGKANLAMVY
jgi:hypothetical protein